MAIQILMFICWAICYYDIYTYIYSRDVSLCGHSCWREACLTRYSQYSVSLQALTWSVFHSIMDPHGRAGLPWVTLHIDVSLLFAMHTYLLNFISSRVSMTHPDTPISLMSGHFRYDLGNDGRAFTLILSSLLPGHGSFLLWSGQWWTCLHTNIVFVMTSTMMDRHLPSLPLVLNFVRWRDASLTSVSLSITDSWVSSQSSLLLFLYFVVTWVNRLCDGPS